MKKNRTVKLDAARSSLPIVHSNIVQLCEERFHAVANGSLEQPVKAHWEILNFELLTLKDCIEHANGDEKKLMQEIICIYQVLISRWYRVDIENLYQTTVINKDDIKYQDRYSQYMMIMDWISLKATCDALFKYSRGANSKPDKDKMKCSVFRTLENLGSGTLLVGDGYLLINNENYRVVCRLCNRNKTSMIYRWNLGLNV